jgi:hypothetical protein
MENSKLKSKISGLIEKINSNSFDSSSLYDFYAAIRWIPKLEEIFPHCFEISNFVAHQQRDRGIIYEKLRANHTISNFIESENLNKTRNVDASEFPCDVFEALMLRDGIEIKRFYDKNKNNQYLRNFKSDPSGKIQKYLNNSFFKHDFSKSLISANEIYNDFFGAFNYLAGMYQLTKYAKFNKSNKIDIIICILSVMVEASIKVEKSVVEPYFLRSDENSFRLIYKNSNHHPIIGVTNINGGSLACTFVNYDFDVSEYHFYDGASELIRDKFGNLIFV